MNKSSVKTNEKNENENLNLLFSPVKGINHIK